ncbi:hypothetical protein [Rhodohalobacter sp. 8-1]|uniref:hypothetical protein n=1 Tax=Rhodohalobacter sp. 8-1 TaxID=3131972 RepID=UPI0030EF4B16
MKKFLYLVHGADYLVKNYTFLGERRAADVLLSTYNKPGKGAYFFPDSTWAEGRNQLLEKALELNEEYEYYIFLDDDISFHKGSYERFEDSLNELNPAVAVPVFIPKTTHSVLGFGISFHHKFFFPLKRYQVCHLADGQFMAFHKDVIKDRILMPLQNQFDEISWWFTSSAQQLLMHNFYGDHTLQMNDVIINNESHREYTKNDYKEQRAEWFQSQFSVPVENPRPWAVNLMSLQGIKYFFLNYRIRDLCKVARQFFNSVAGTFRYKKAESYRLMKEEVLQKLKPDSVLFKQYMAGRQPYETFQQVQKNSRTS